MDITMAPKFDQLATAKMRMISISSAIALSETRNRAAIRVSARIAERGTIESPSERNCRGSPSPGS